MMSADRDKSGSLDRAEMKRTFSQQSCQDKMKKLQLNIPDWDSLFDQLDTDGSGDVTWNEVSQGMEIYWRNSQTTKAQDSLARLSKFQDSRPTTTGSSSMSDSR